MCMCDSSRALTGCVYACVWRPETTSELQGSTGLCVISTGLTSLSHWAQLFFFFSCGFWGIELSIHSHPPERSAHLACLIKVTGL